jgi:hypothetical protein
VKRVQVSSRKVFQIRSDLTAGETLHVSCFSNSENDTNDPNNFLHLLVSSAFETSIQETRGACMFISRVVRVAV